MIKGEKSCNTVLVPTPRRIRTRTKGRRRFRAGENSASTRTNLVVVSIL